MSLAIGVHGFQGGDEIVDAAELPVNRCKSDVGHLTHLLELNQHHLSNVCTGHLSATALLKSQLQKNLLKTKPILKNNFLFCLKILN